MKHISCAFCFSLRRLIFSQKDRNKEQLSGGQRWGIRRGWEWEGGGCATNINILVVICTLVLQMLPLEETGSVAHKTSLQ